MAKVKAPLMSLGASGKLGGALVFFPWKGINAVRTYVIPANPQTTRQTTQRSYMTDAVDFIHDLQAHATQPLTADDITAFRGQAGTRPDPLTWFNEMCRQYIAQQVAAGGFVCISNVTLVAGANQLTITGGQVMGTIGPPTADDLVYGTSPTAMFNVIATTPAALAGGVVIPGLTTGIKYYVQVRPTLAAGYIGCRGGIYTGYPT